MKFHTDIEILELIASLDESDKDLAFREIYLKCYPSIKVYILKNNGLEDDAKDIFQESVIVFYRKLKHEKLKLTSSIQTYLYAICKNMWLDKLRADKTHKKVIEQNHPKDSFTVDTEQSYTAHEKTNIVMQLINQLNQDCKSLLIKFYYDKYSMRDIAEILDLGSEQAAKNKKVRCMKRLKEIVGNYPELEQMLR